MGTFLSSYLSNPNDCDYLDSSFSEDSEEVSEESNMRLDYQEDQIVDSLDSICLDSATDAVSTEASTSSTHITITLNHVHLSEEELDLYEKVSLVYLLYEDPRLAYQELNKLLRGGHERLLYKWANYHQHTSQKWQDKFIEALSIIQNYQLLKNFGYNRKEINEIFLPHHTFTSLNVNKTRKALYCLCEHLTHLETKNLLDAVTLDIKENKKIEFLIDSTYLELYLLQWEEVGYIKLDNLSNLCAVLKQLEYFEWYDRLKEIGCSAVSQKVLVPRQKVVDVKYQKKSNKIFESLLSNETSLETLMSLESPISADAGHKDTNIYDINPRKPGVCLIINQENFYTECDSKYQKLLSETKLESRQGTQKDKRDLESTFKMFNFITEVVDNLTHIEIIEEIRRVLQKITKESSLFICIMSHGDEGVIYGVNSCRVSVKHIQDMMCSMNRANLLGKPKILILQSCQGTRCQKLSRSYEDHEDSVTTDGPSSSKEKVVPPRADLFTFWATVPGFGAIRDKRTGSWFIQSLCDKMKSLGDRYHFEDICTEVIGDVSSKMWCQKSENVVAMVPMKDSTLRKKFYLPPIQR